MIEFVVTLDGAEAKKKADVIKLCYKLPAMNEGDKLHLSYRFLDYSDDLSIDPENVIQMLDHVTPETFKIKSIDTHRLKGYINKLQTLLRLAEKVRTMARFVPSELPKPKPERKSWWKRLWS